MRGSRGAGPGAAKRIACFVLLVMGLDASWLLAQVPAVSPQPPGQAIATGSVPLPSGLIGFQEAYTRAKESDPTFAAARAALVAVQKKVPQARSALLPALTAAGSGGYTDGQTSYTDTPQLSRSFRQYEWALQLTQPLVRVPNVYAYDEAHALALQAEAQFAQAQEDLIVRTAQVYFDVLTAQETLAASQAQVRALEEQQAAAERSYRAGVVSVTDVDDSRARAAASKAEQLAAAADLDAKRAAFEAVVGPGTPSLIALPQGTVLPGPDPMAPALWAARAEEDNPSARAALAGLKAAQYELSRTHAQRLPQVDLVASYGGNYSSGNIVNPIDYATHVRDKEVNVQVSVPILDGGGLGAQVGESRARLNEAQAQYEAARRAAASDARQAFAKVSGSLAQASALEASVSSGENSVKGNRAGYALGIRINSDVLGAEQQLYAARRDLAQARYGSLMEGLKLKAAAGTLTEADVAAIDRLLH